MTRYVLFALAMPILVLARPAAVDASGAPDRHFVVFAAQSGTFYDHSGPAFVMLIRTAGDTAEVGAIGIYEADTKPAFGAVPETTYSRFLDRPPEGSDVMLRLEISGAQYQKSLHVLRAWERRAREGHLLYPDLFMNNILFVKQAAEALDCCGATIALYALDWGLEDDISEDNIPSRIPFQFFKELRRLNESRHVPDAAMPAAVRSAGPASPAAQR